MLVVGLELTAGDLRRVLRYPRAVTVATLGQLLLIPACAALLIEFGTRNLGLVAVMGVLVLGEVKLVLFATLFFLAELPLVLLLIALRARRVGKAGRDPGLRTQGPGPGTGREAGHRASAGAVGAAHRGLPFESHLFGTQGSRP